MEVVEEIIRRLFQVIVVYFKNEIYYIIYMIIKYMLVECVWLKESVYNLFLNEDNVYVLQKVK